MTSHKLDTFCYGVEKNSYWDCYFGKMKKNKRNLKILKTIVHLRFYVKSFSYGAKEFLKLEDFELSNPSYYKLVLLKINFEKLSNTYTSIMGSKPLISQTLKLCCDA